jgi:nitroimidazol reductase NimA-like FMN-containing flavoprotein (pyridoxamine 5'-phosphate oxidase superfamily)
MPTPRTTVRRLPKRGHYDRETIAAILDEGLLCHVGFALEGQPFVIPTLYGRRGGRLYLHGSAVSRMLRTLAGGVPVCVTVTLADGLVLARSAFNHSMNYRSVVVLGTATGVEGEEKRAALEAIAEHVVPGRWNETREPNANELKATLVLSIPLDEASAKVRTGPPVDEDEDYALPHWAGVLPLALAAGSPLPDPRLPAGTPVPPSVSGWRRPRGG